MLSSRLKQRVQHLRIASGRSLIFLSNPVAINTTPTPILFKSNPKRSIHSGSIIEQSMTVEWKPVELTPSLPEKQKLRSSTFPPESSVDATTIVSGSTPFDKSLPGRTSPGFLRKVKINPGTHYAVYSLIPLSNSKFSAIISSLATGHVDEDWLHSFKAAPTWDFSTANKNSMRDIYDYHTSLLETVRGNPHMLLADRLIVVAHADWEDNGVLLVELDCHVDKPGTIGMMRLPTQMTGPTIMLRESEPDNWAPVKQMEGYSTWKDGIEGYTGTKWEKVDEDWDELEEGRPEQVGVLEPPSKVTKLAMTGQKTA